MLHDLTLNQLRKIAFKLAVDLNLSHNFNKESQIADRDWVQEKFV